ncbi:MAG: hypothetical protein IBX64_00950 [Actinobacteria bacterium]|nr:hypothetical protein [Actinomycetota bacterium]
MKKLFIRGNKGTGIIGLIVIFVAILLVTCEATLGANWSGVDESVVEYYAEQAGRPAWTPLINTDRGDLLLFMFLLAGAIGGFVIGYYWRTLFNDTKWVRREHASNEKILDGKGSKVDERK